MGLSPTAVLARVQRLAREGFILGHEARLNPGCHMVAGGCDYLLKTRSAGMDAYRRFAGEVLWQLPGALMR